MIDTSSKNGILENMDSKTRNMVRKAQKLGVRITFDSSNVNLSARVFQKGENHANGLALIHNYSSEFLFGNTHAEIVGDNVANWLGAWHYFTVSHNSGTTRLFRDGTQVDDSTSLATVTNTDPLYFGVYPGALTGIRSNAFLSEWQFTKGTGKYTSNFTAPTGAQLT